MAEEEQEEREEQEGEEGFRRIYKDAAPKVQGPHVSGFR